MLLTAFWLGRTLLALVQRQLRADVTQELTGSARERAAGALELGTRCVGQKGQLPLGPGSQTRLALLTALWQECSLHAIYPRGNQ